MKKFFLLSAAVVAAGTMFADDYYVIGSNVNGNSWACGVESCKMTDMGNGIYEWDGEVLGSGFKFNDGQWADVDLGGGDEPIVLGETFQMFSHGANIAFEDFTEVKNPHIVLDANNLTMVLTGTADGVYVWYLVGDFNNYAGPAGDEGTACPFTEVGDKLFAYEGIEFTTGDCVLKMANTGWAKQYGDNDGTIMWAINTIVSEGVNGATLMECGSEGTMPCYLFGKYNVSWNLNTLYLEFVEEGAGVKNVEAVNGAAEYFNLQGVKVAEPANGLYIKVVNGKATKVVVR